jgi:hypothetical protein
VSKLASLRDELRPHGTMARDCSKCVHFEECGGIEPKRLLFETDCFHMDYEYCKSRCGAGVPDACDLVCPHNPRYVKSLSQVGGLIFSDLPPLRQTPTELPLYIPLIHHGYCHRQPLSCPVVALDTYQVVKLREDRMQTVADDPSKLRACFGLSPNASVILRGVASDRPLERYWSYRRRDAVPVQLARLNLLLAVGPNFSHFLDTPRTDNLFNRKRQLICLGEFQSAGLNPVPHLSATQPGDWRFWNQYLADNPTIRHVAVEFETGNRDRSEGRKVVKNLAAIQQSIGRPLHPLVIGGTQFLEQFAHQFADASFIDSTPFVKAAMRHAADWKGQRLGWDASITLVGQGVDNILGKNIEHYARWLEGRWRAATRTTTQ